MQDASRPDSPAASGTLSIESEPGQGATVYLRLPLPEEAAHA